MKKRVGLLISLFVSFCISACDMVVLPDSTGAGTSSSSKPSSESGISEGLESSFESSSSEQDQTSGTSEKDESSSSSSSSEVAPLGVHFPHLGNNTSGDCTLIDVGDVEVLIDAGSTTGSANYIVPYIQNYCEDGVLEYVIVTHMHEDHIAAFAGSTSGKFLNGVFKSFVCETIIDSPLTSASSQAYKNYVTLRDEEVAEGAEHYTALECWNNTNGAKRSYELGNEVTLNILYQKYYTEKTSSENNYSVCVLITQGENNYLFTGDLEDSGEASLVESNDLPKCKLFKAGHHGSKTSNTQKLLSVIQPEVVVACCCCGSQATYNFPNQEFIDNISIYTDKLYIPAVLNGKLNGDITVSCLDGKAVSVNCSNNNTLFKDTAWFKANRTLPEAWRE